MISIRKYGKSLISFYKKILKLFYDSQIKSYIIFKRKIIQQYNNSSAHSNLSIASIRERELSTRMPRLFMSFNVFSNCSVLFPSMFLKMFYMNISLSISLLYIKNSKRHRLCFFIIKCNFDCILFSNYMKFLYCDYIKNTKI